MLHLVGYEDNVGNGDEESEDRNYPPAAVVSPSCATIKNPEETERKRREKKWERVTGLTKVGVQSSAALEEQSDRLGVSG
ncbi:hypothetical protein INR49_009242 [Caranx melampygus]|nr:hypothetical protein INR49_009242 [Caranx melampygus]